MAAVEERDSDGVRVKRVLNAELSGVGGAERGWDDVMEVNGYEGDIETIACIIICFR